MIWLILVILTGSEDESVLLKRPIFDTKELCTTYIVDNYAPLNEYINKKYKLHKDTPNLFHCTSLSKK
jgi:hypothetical protein|tara:strand:- start:157 stop:360 length:204 start_codon:yes stop_codon:yes gene_type:complete